MLEHIKRMFASIANKISAFFQKHEKKIVATVAAIIFISSFIIAFNCGAYPMDDLFGTAVICFVINFIFGFCFGACAVSLMFAGYIYIKSLMGANHVNYA